MAKSLHRSLEAKLAALDGPEWDSSDEEGGNENTVPATISSVAKRGKKRAALKKRLKTLTTSNKDSEPSAVIYLGHLPPLFEELEIRSFLSQFGAVKKCRVSRSKKTGRPRGYAFVEFSDPEVAKIVAETMGGYFLMEKRLVCHVVPRDKLHPMMFEGCKKRFHKVDWQEKNRAEVNKPRTTNELKKITERLVKREELKRKKLKELGIDYDFPGYSAGVSGALAHEKGNEESGKARAEEGAVGKPTPVVEEKRRRKGSEASTGSEAGARGEGRKSSTKKRRKNSEASMDSADDGAACGNVETMQDKEEGDKGLSTKKKKRRKDSEASLESAGSNLPEADNAVDQSEQANQKKSEQKNKKKHRKKSEASIDEADATPEKSADELREAQTSVKKTKKKKKDGKKRRQST